MVLQKLKISAPPYSDKVETTVEECIRNSWSSLRQNLKEFVKFEELRLIDTGIKITKLPVKGDFLSINKFVQQRFERNIFRQYL